VAAPGAQGGRPGGDLDRPQVHGDAAPRLAQQGLLHQGQVQLAGVRKEFPAAVNGDPRRPHGLLQVGLQLLDDVEPLHGGGEAPDPLQGNGVAEPHLQDGGVGQHLPDVAEGHAGGDDAHLGRAPENGVPEVALLGQGAGGGQPLLHFVAALPGVAGEHDVLGDVLEVPL